MGISHFFVGRPTFAPVIAIVIMLGGVAGLLSLPIAQYPDIAPPSVQIGTYSRASAETLETSVTQIIEQQLTGIDGLQYFSSTSDSSGSVSITVTFVKGTNPDSRTTSPASAESGRARCSGRNMQCESGSTPPSSSRCN